MQAQNLTFLFLVLIGFSLPDSRAADQESIHVTVTGRLQTGIVAIGGETTGTTITAKGVTWELHFGQELMLSERVSKLGGKLVTVSGSLARRKGVETGERWIVSVTKLKMAGEKKNPPIDAKPKRDTSQIEISGDDRKAIIDVTSKFGIDTATLTRRTEHWPNETLVRLHLSGLESFKIEAGKIAVNWSVSSTGDHQSRVALLKAGKETPIAKGSPYYSLVAIVDSNGKIPLKGGYFEVPLPAKLLEDNPDTITLRWIDFYR
ncbi:MAG: hypothetical protein ACI9UA_001498 [Pseudoalteromonas tetraodonis]|jgi:hypothetical protein